MPYDEISTYRYTMLQFTDDRQVRPGALVGEEPDLSKTRPLTESKRQVFEASREVVQPLLDANKQVYYCEDMWRTRFTPKESGGPKSLWWTGVTIFECYKPPEGAPESVSPGRTHEGLQMDGPCLYFAPGSLQRIGIWERVDFGVWNLQFPEGRGAPPPDQVYRRVTLFFDPTDFEKEKRSGIVWESQQGDLIEDIWFRPGQANRDFLQREIAQVLGCAAMESCRTWDILTQFYFDPSLGDHQRFERLLPVAAGAGAPMQVRVLYLAAGGSPALVRAELAKLIRDMERYFPHCQVTVVRGEMPFEEEVLSFGSYFDKATFSTKGEAEKRKRIPTSPSRNDQQGSW